MKCPNEDQSCHLGNILMWKRCEIRMSKQNGFKVKCSQLEFGYTHFPDSPFGNVDICVHGVCRTHGTNDDKCKWCG